MAWNCPECNYLNNDSMVRCVCGYESIEFNENESNNRQDQGVHIKSSWSRIIVEALIIFIATAIPTFILGLIWSSPGPNDSIELIEFKLKFYYASIAIEVIGFIIVGCLHKNNRFSHLFLVATVLWVFSLSNYFIKPFSFRSLIQSFIHVVIAMIIGGFVSLIFVRRSKHLKAI